MSDYIEHGAGVPVEVRNSERALADKVRGQNKFKVLDVCCRRFPRGYGVDLHQESNADLLCDAHNLKPLADNSFDLTVCVEGIEHLFNPSKAVREWARVTKYALMVTTQNAHCWRRWFSWHPFDRCTSPDHIYMWDSYTFRNFFRNNFPESIIEIGYYDRYLKKTRNFKPKIFFHENIFAYVWLTKYEHFGDSLKWFEIREEALRLINSRPEAYLKPREYTDRTTDIFKCVGIGITYGDKK